MAATKQARLENDQFILMEHLEKAVTTTVFQENALSPLLRKRRSCEMVPAPSSCVKKALFQLDQLKEIMRAKYADYEKSESGDSNFGIQDKTKIWKHLRFFSPQISHDLSENEMLPEKQTLSVQGVGGQISHEKEKPQSNMSPDDIFEQVEALIKRLEDDRNATLALLQREKELVESLGRKIDQLNMRRMEQLPDAVQKEHDACATDISELYWHVSYTERQLKRSKDRLNVAQDLNNRLKEDIDFVKKHCPLVEEKLLLEKEAMRKIQILQKQTDKELFDARNLLEAAEKNYKQVVEKAEEERQNTRERLEGVRGQLRLLKKDHQHSQMMHQAYIKKAEQNREKLKQQEAELEELKSLSVKARQAEEEELFKIDDLNDKLKKVEFETGEVNQEKDAIETKIEKLHQDMKLEIHMHELAHGSHLRRLRELQEGNGELKLDIEDMQIEIKSCNKSITKCEKELERYRKDRERCDKMLKDASQELQNVTVVNMELKSQLEKEENKAQAMEDQLKSTADNLRRHVAEEMKQRTKLETKKKENASALYKGKSENKKKKTKVKKTLSETEKQVARVQAEVDALREQYDQQNKIIEEQETKLSNLKTEYTNVESTLTGEKGELAPMERALLDEKVAIDEKIKQMEFEERQMQQKLKDMTISKNAMNKRIAATEINIDKFTAELDDLNIKLESEKKLNDSLKQQLDEATARVTDRQKNHDAMMAERKNVKEKLEQKIAEELKINEELAASYKHLQNEHIDIKNRLMGIYDSKVKLETSIKDHKQLVALQEKLNEALKQYYKDRTNYNKASLHRFNDDSESNSGLMIKVQKGLERALNNISNFLKSQIDGGVSDEVHNAAMRGLTQIT